MPLPNLNQLQISQPQPATMKMQAMQMENRLKTIGIAEDRNAIARESQALQREGFEFNKMKQNLGMMRDFMPSIERDEMDKVKEHMRKIGINSALVDMLPSSQQALDMEEGEWGETKGRMMYGADKIADMQNEAYKALIRETEEAAKQKNRIALKRTPSGSEPKTLASKWLEDNPDATEEEIIAFNQRMKGKGVRITTSPDGSTVVEMGGGSDMTLKTQGAIEEKLLGGKEQYQRMKIIADEFKPEFQEIGFRLGKGWTGIQARLGQDVAESDKNSLIEFKKYQRKAIENINLYIKEMTGAQMSEKEADRLRLAQPDPGENWYNGDDPITFKAKQDDVLKGARAAVARYTYYKNKGLQDQEIKQLINTNQAVSLESIIAGMGE